MEIMLAIKNNSSKVCMYQFIDLLLCTVSVHILLSKLSNSMIISLSGLPLLAAYLRGVFYFIPSRSFKIITNNLATIKTY